MARRFVPEPYVRVAASYQTDPRIMAVGNDGELLFLRGLALARLSRSDGHLHHAQIRFLTIGMTDADDVVDALVREGLWQSCNDGWRVPIEKWERWQVTEEERVATRTATRERQAKWRAQQRTLDEAMRELPGERY